MTGRPSLNIGLASLVVVAVLTLQAAAVFGAISSLLWPFTDYPMYREAHYDGERLNRYTVVGILGEATEVTLLPEDLGFNLWQFEKHLVRPLSRQHMEREDEKRLAIALQIYQAKHRRTLTALRLENHPFVLSKSGMREAPTEVVKTVNLDSLSVRLQ